MSVRQVGGTHYDSEGIKHWDWVAACGLGYFDGQASKYIIRWQDKGGVQDVQKALSYVQKLKEVVTDYRVRRDFTPVGERTAEMYSLTRSLCRGYDLCLTEEEIVYKFLVWKSLRDLDEIETLMWRLLLSEDKELPVDPYPDLMVSKPVPLEDSNKHADRATVGSGGGRMTSGSANFEDFADPDDNELAGN